MNVIVANEQQNLLSTLDIDIIKSISGTYEANEIVEMFKNFFYSKMILDVTAIKNYEDVQSFQTIATGLDAEKIIFLLPEGSRICTSNFLSKIIEMGIYNFTTNLDGVKYLLKKSNTYNDVSRIVQMQTLSTTVVDKVNDGSKIIGIKNVTDQAGATTLIYMLKKELEEVLGKNDVLAIEVNKKDFQLFGDKNMLSVGAGELKNTINQNLNKKVILVDLNDMTDDSMCGEVLYLLEPSMVKLNRLMRRNRNIFSKLKGKKIILNKSLLSNKDITDFEYESNSQIFYNVPPLNERKRNNMLQDFLSRLGIISEEEDKKESNKIFGLFRR